MTTAMMSEDALKIQRSRNIRTGLIVAAIALGLFVSIIVRTWYLRGG